MNTETQTFDVPALIEYMMGNMGINPFTIYCQLTGKPIGRIDADELAPFMTGDIEQVADDLFVRIIASMRPSIHWNVMREDSLDTMAKSRPIETLAYLMNRLFQPNDFYKLPLAARMDDQHQRIKLYEFLSKCGECERGNLYAMLIEVDAKMNLTQQRIDMRCVDFMLDYDESMKKLTAWYLACIKRWNKSQKAEQDSRNWFKGNTMAKPAFFRSFMEAKPETKVAAKVRVKKERDTSLDALFDEVMAESKEVMAMTPETGLMAKTPASATPVKSFAGRAPAFLRKAI